MYKSFTFHRSALNNVFIETIVKRQQTYNYKNEEKKLRGKEYYHLQC